MRAAHELRNKSPEAAITVVDIDKAALKEAAGLGFETAPMDAVSFLLLNEKKMSLDDWIVPAVPVHAAYEWVRQKLRREAVFKEIAVPGEIAELLPNPYKGENGQMYLSNAEFECPDDCDEPDEFCTITGKPRPQVMCTSMSSVQVPGFRSVVVVSMQLSPGVGGFQLVSFRHAMTDIKAEAGKILFGTACKCHGVMHAFEWHPK